MTSSKQRLVLGVDPGLEQSAVVLYDGATIVYRATLENEACRQLLGRSFFEGAPVVLVLEKLESFGMPVGREVFDTVFWCGRFVERWHPRVWAQLPRRAVKIHLCQTARATDANVRQALIDRFGGTKATAIGTKRQMGPLYGVKGHQWSALAVAVTAWDGGTGENKHD